MERYRSKSLKGRESGKKVSENYGDDLVNILKVIFQFSISNLD